jgi:hypothetical protein
MAQSFRDLKATWIWKSWKCEKLEALSQEIGKMLSGLSKYLTAEIRLSLAKN